LAIDSSDERAKSEESGVTIPQGIGEIGCEKAKELASR
jgi:hypothetical protein